MTKRLFVSMAAMGIVGGMAFSANAETLTWNGARGARWNDANWLDAGNNPVAWQDGADAVFPGGAFVEVQDSVRPASITFTGNGATIVGAGRIVLPGDLTASVAGTTNSIVAKLVGDATFTKRGAGAVAVSFAKGSAVAAEGTLLVAGSRSAELRATASGGTVEALGEGTQAASLLANGSFEATTASSSYVYMNGQEAGTGVADKENTAVAPWKVTEQVVLANSAGVKTWCGSGGITGTGIPDGDQLCILQRFGSIMQEVTVAEAGWYDLSFTYFKRGNNYTDHRITIFVDDVTAASLLANMIQPHQVRFSSGPVWFTAGTHAIRFSGEGWWRDVSTFVDDIRLAPPTAGVLPQSAAKAANAVSGDWSSAALWADGTPPTAGGSATTSLYFPLVDGLASANDLAGTFLFNSLRFNGVASGETASLSGNALSSRRDSSSHGYLYLDTLGGLCIGTALTVNSNLVVDTEGDLVLTGSVNTVLAEGSAFEKTGNGTLAIGGSLSNVGRAYVTDGTFELRTIPAGMGFYLRSATNTAPTVSFNVSADTSANIFVDAQGAGLPTVVMRTGKGVRLTNSNNLNCYGPQVRVDVGEGDTLEFNALQQCTWRYPLGSTSLLKTGPGTFSVLNAPTAMTPLPASPEGVLGALRGGITVREGTLRFHADDFNPNCGLANIYTGRVFPSDREGTLGSDTATPLMLGDELTPAGATVGIGGRNSHTCSSRTFIATPYPDQVVFSAVSNGVYHMGRIILRRSDFTLGGPTGDVADVNVMLTNVELDGVPAATISRSGNVRTILNATNYPVGLTLTSDRMFEVGFRRSLPVSIDTLSLSGGWQVSFDAAGNDSVTATNLVLGATEITLWDDMNETAFAQPGTYTLLRYGTLSGDVSSLSIADACKLPGYGYRLADDGAGTITLTIETAADNPVYTWIGTAGGTWGDASNWDHPTAPNGVDAQAVLGPAPQSAATVNLASSATVNALTLYNANGYTLTGAALQFDGAAPSILASAGTHEIQAPVSNLTATPLSVQSTAQGNVRFAGDVASDLAVERGQATLAQGANIDGNVVVTGATLTVEAGADVTGTTTLGQDGKLVAGPAAVVDSIASTDTSAEIVVNDTLTLGGTASSFGGKVSGTGTVVKDGATTLTLNGLSLTQSGGTVVKAGTLAVGSAMLPGETWLADGATLKSSGLNHGLTGRYYGYYTAANQTSFAGRVYSLDDFTAMMTSMTFREQHMTPLATALSFGDGKENAFPSAFAGNTGDRWAAAYTANLVVPESGLYSFYSLSDDQLIFMIDDYKVLSVNGAGVASYGGCYLEKGIHTLYLGLLEITSDAYVTLYVKQPSESDYKLVPGDWLVPDVGAATLAGRGTVAADAGTVTSVGAGVDTGFNSGFAGSFAAANGGLVQKTGGGIMTAERVSGDVAAKGGELALAGNGTFDTVRASDGGSVHIIGGTIRNLFGDGKAAFGNRVYTVPRITGDADSGFSTNKTYTHLVNFPLGSQVPVINGVTVNNTGTWSWGGTQPTSSWGSDGGSTATGYARMVYRFIYGSADFNVTLSGLTPGKLYDWRLYFRNFGTNNRNVVFAFSRGGEEIGRVNWNPDKDENGSGQPYTAVGCRYVAGTDGKVTVRVISLVSADKCHFYGFSNEQLGDFSGTQDVVSLQPAAGETARLTGGISGTAALSLDGAGTQVLGGTNSLPVPLAVNAGRLVLDSSAVVTAGVTVASGATVELQGSAQVNGISGAGSLHLGLGDNDPWGALQADGTFAAPEWPRRVNIAGDADSGIAPFKKYTHFFDLGWADSTIRIVNGVPVFCSDGLDANTSYLDRHHGGSFKGAPASWLKDQSNANHKNIKMDSSNAMRAFFTCFQYAGNVTLTLSNLTVGKLYEFRLYIRNWASQNRTIDLTYNDGTGNKTFAFNEDTAPDGYIALRYTPAYSPSAGTTFTLRGDKRDQGFHIYAFSNEEVAEHVRVVNVDADMTYSGAISGNGELRKTGAGAWTLTGAGTASGAWTVAEGALVLDGATATTGPVAVAPGASFGGVGSAGGMIGVASGATLLLGTDNSAGTLAAGSNVVIAAGAAVTVRYASDGSCGALASAGSVTVPASLTVTASPLVAGTKLTRRVQLFAAETALNGPSDLSGWTAVDAEGAPLRGAKFTYGDDGKSIWLNATSGTLIYFR